MLTLSRREQERIRLTTPDGSIIWIVLCEAERGRARIGISAPKEVEIKREELLNQGDSNGLPRRD